MNFSHILSALAGIGGYIVLQATVDYIDRRGETQVAQACVSQKVEGKWTPTACTGAKR